MFESELRGIINQYGGHQIYTPLSILGARSLFALRKVLQGLKTNLGSECSVGFNRFYCMLIAIFRLANGYSIRLVDNYFILGYRPISKYPPSLWNYHGY